MAYQEKVGSLLRLTVAATYPNVQVQETNHVFLCVSAGGGDSRAALNSLIFSMYNGLYRSAMSSNSKLYGIICHTLELFPAPAPVSQQPDLVGLAGGDLMPTQVRPLISWKTDQAGRAFRGRTYLFTPGTDMLGSDGHQAAPLISKIADMANAFGVRVYPHFWGTGVALAAALQLIATLPDNPPSLNPIPPLLELDQSDHPIRMAILTEPIRHQGGWVDVPTGPGLGIEIDRVAMAKFLID